MSVFEGTRSALGLGMAAMLMLAAPVSPGQEPVAGQEKRLVFEEQDGMAIVLNRLEGKPVRMRLVGSNEEVVGRLQKVGKELVHLSDLSGREFFDAVVRIDQVSAVSVQIRGR